MHFVGGAERLMTDLAVGLADAQIQVDFVTGMCHDYWRAELSQKAGVSVKELGHAATGNLSFWLNVKGFAKALAKLINSETDLIVTSSFPSSIAAGLFTKQHNAKVAHYLHEAPMVLHDKEGLKTLPSRLRMFYQLVSKRYAPDDVKAVQRSDIIMTNSQLSKKVNAAAYNIDESRIRVIYPGVNIAHMTASALGSQLVSNYVRDGIPVIFFPRGAQFWRNPKICLHALQRLKLGDFVAIFTGGADYEADALMRHAGSLGIADNVLWIKELTDEALSALYSRSSAVVSIPKRQPFGLIPLEALICGAPPIISHYSGVSEVLRNGVDTICVDGDNSEQLADAIETLLLDAETRRHIVSNGQQRVFTDFTSSRFVKDILANLSSL